MAKVERLETNFRKEHVIVDGTKDSDRPTLTGGGPHGYFLSARRLQFQGSHVRSGQLLQPGEERGETDALCLYLAASA